MATNSAVVETLTAEVRVLMVGNRQVTLSVFRQLDLMHPRSLALGLFRPFGRVRSKTTDEFWSIPFELVGQRVDNGALVGVHVTLEKWTQCTPEEREVLQKAYEDLPLIVLAGLR